MENQDKNHTDEPIPKNHFTPNSRYFTILVYALAFVLGAILIYIFIGHFNVTLRLIGQITHLLSPFITGAFIAFVFIRWCICFTGMSLPNGLRWLCALQKCFLY